MNETGLLKVQVYMKYDATGVEPTPEQLRAAKLEALEAALADLKGEMK